MLIPHLLVSLTKVMVCFSFGPGMKPNSRREILLRRMDELESQGKSCLGCSGTCCTFEANSMMVTPLEALEILRTLPERDSEFKATILQTISKFRLDHPSGNGRKSFIRRTYTCPFFNHKELGCPLPREVKPYGCLGFNAHDDILKAGPSCYSEKEILAQRDLEHKYEDEMNRKLREKFKLYWDKTPLPLALIELWDAQFSDEDLQVD